MKPEIVVVDLIWSGHVPSFHKMICKAFIDLNYYVLSVSPAPEEVSEYINSTDVKCITSPAPLSKSIRFRFFGRFSHKFHSFNTAAQTLLAKHYWRSIYQLIDQYKTTSSPKVFFPYLDYRLSPLGITLTAWLNKSFPYSWSGLYINAYRLVEDISIQNLKSKHTEYIYLLDERFLQTIQQQTNKSTLHFPEVVDNTVEKITTSELATNIQKKADGRTVISLIGVLNPKKHLTFLLEAAKDAQEQNLPYLFCFIGEIYWESWTEHEIAFIKEQFNALQNIFYHTERIANDAEFASVYQASDIIFAMRNSDGSSNAISNAAFHQKPLIVKEGNLLVTNRVKRYHLGIATDTQETKNLFSSIAQSLNLKQSPQFAEGCQQYLSDNSILALRNSLKNIATN